MIELEQEALCFSFPDVHPDACLRVEFIRTLRVPDDGKAYPLPPGLGRFPLFHVDDYEKDVPESWLKRGGVMLPMHQSEAMWVRLESEFVADRGVCYPFAVKVAAGKINAVNGASWTNSLSRTRQDYLVAPDQPWLDGYCVGKGVVRQFVAMPLQEGFTAEEQITGRAVHGGVQVIAFPMKRSHFEKRFPLMREKKQDVFGEAFQMREPVAAPFPPMGLAPGGAIRQQVYEDPFGFNAWELRRKSRCFVHIANSRAWHAITGSVPPFSPPSAAFYNNAGLPWYEYYDESRSLLEGSECLCALKTVPGTQADPKTGGRKREKGFSPRYVERLRPSHRTRVRGGNF